MSKTIWETDLWNNSENILWWPVCVISMNNPFSGMMTPKNIYCTLVSFMALVVLKTSFTQSSSWKLTSNMWTWDGKAEGCFFGGSGILWSPKESNCPKTASKVLRSFGLLEKTSMFPTLTAKNLTESGNVNIARLLFYYICLLTGYTNTLFTPKYGRALSWQFRGVLTGYGCKIMCNCSDSLDGAKDTLQEVINKSPYIFDGKAKPSKI